MNRHETPDCGRAREELAALLYGELDAAAAARVEEHLEGCADCRAERDGLAETRRLLDAWSPAGAGDVRADAARVAREILARRSRPARSRRALIAGVAAALVAFLGLASFGTEVEVGGGRLRLSFALPWVPAAVPDAVRGGAGTLARDERGWPTAWAEEVRAIARAEADARAEDLNRVQLSTLEDWRLREEEQRLLLARAIDVARTRDRESFAALVGAVQRGAVRESRYTREAVLELASLVASAEEQGIQGDRR